MHLAEKEEHGSNIEIKLAMEGKSEPFPSGMIPKLYVRYLESKKDEELERELDKREEETWDRIVEELKKKKQ